MAKVKEAAEKPASSPIDEEKLKKIKALECKKHQRIFLLMEMGMEKEDIMKAAGCNAGEISNVKKQYADATKAEAARALLA